MSERNSNSNRGPRWLHSVVLVTFLAIAAFFLFTEHRAHLYGVLPYLLGHAWQISLQKRFRKPVATFS